jgi:pyruvate/2-oxoglutarate dehydrogenase complex dihydrolipoamide acyltransferase (E2) component
VDQAAHHQARHRSAISQPKAARAAFRAFEPQFRRLRQRIETSPPVKFDKTIAKRLVTSLGPVPHFFLTTDIEMDRAAEMRKGINALDPDLKISINDIIIKVRGGA